MSDKHENFIHKGEYVLNKDTQALAMDSLDAVNHPAHYTSHPSGLECWQVVQHLPAELKDVIKYLWRTDLKNGAEDIRKAVWYLRENGFVTFQILQRCKEIYAVNATYAEIAYKFEEVDLTPKGQQILRKVGHTILGDALSLLICGVNGDDLDDFVRGTYALERRISEELEKVGK